MSETVASRAVKDRPIRVGISSCLLGKKVRYDGGHKRDRYLKSDSPSGGMGRVRVYGDGGMASKTGVGIFARALLDRFPFLPVEEEGRLHDLSLRENFVERIFCYRRWRDLTAGGLTRGKLVAFTPPTSSCSWPTAPSTTPRWAGWWPPPRRAPRASWKPTTAISS
ncbi:MAG: DUF523 and DUF1722 domain-containing protein [candidate division NC10 bacterium]